MAVALVINNVIVIIYITIIITITIIINVIPSLQRLSYVITVFSLRNALKGKPTVCFLCHYLDALKHACVLCRV